MQVEHLGDALCGGGLAGDYSVGCIFDQIRSRGLVKFACLVPIRNIRSTSCVVTVVPWIIRYLTLCSGACIAATRVA